MSFVRKESLISDVKRHLMPNVDFDGTVTVENAERYFLNLIEKHQVENTEEVVYCKDCSRRYTKFCNAKHETPDKGFCSSGIR